MEGVRRDGGQDQHWAVFVSRGCQYQVTVSFHLPSLQPSPVSWTVKQHARVCARRAGDGSLERPLIIVCNADPSTVDEPAVMHVVSADTTVADTIRYDTPSIGSDTIPIR